MSMAGLRTRIKICGITRVQDALAVVGAGADAIGLVFYDPSPRSVRIEQAREIANAVPAFVSVVALFVNPIQEKVQEVLNNVRIDLVQFHGDEDETVLIDQSEAINHAYSKNNLPVEMNTLKGKKHGGAAFYTGKSREKVLQFLKGIIQ